MQLGCGIGLQDSRLVRMPARVHLWMVHGSLLQVVYRACSRSSRSRQVLRWESTRQEYKRHQRPQYYKCDPLLQLKLQEYLTASYKYVASSMRSPPSATLVPDEDFGVK
ncbi:hypothetical protein E2C01_011419 [Portunus trituberculatus]|uniref:Uncharacterized protein n=1 Tax=Portunus trituberculatus TaxID=210409 RepID=A0A5B7DB55_PORTR|nr:hypothetical protein [Portunus trituberculatus]